MARRERYTAEEAATVIVNDDEQLSDIESEDEAFEAEGLEIIEDENSDDYQTQPSSEDEDDDEEEPDQNGDADVSRYRTSIEGVSWTRRSPSCRGRPMAANIVRPPPGPTNLVPLILEDPIDAFEVTFPADLLALVLQCTNQRYQKYCNENRRSRIFARFGGYSPFVTEEIQAFIGLLLIQGAYKCAKLPLKELYKPTFLPHFRAVLSRDRFQLLYLCCRFDNLTTRKERQKNDRMAPIRELWDRFFQLCTRLYNPTTCVTVDEQLVKFRGRCSFRQFLPNKPGKYGLKVWVAADSASHYCFNASVYLGKHEEPVRDGLGASVVKKLVQPLYNSGRNITFDRFFTSVDLSKYLLQHNLTSVGTVMPNRRGLPLALLPKNARQRDVGSSMFAYQDNLTMVSFKAKKTKVVLMLSTFHHNDALVDGKPEVVHYYNKTKCGVDALDQLVRNYSCYRKSRRWPMALFADIIDIAAYNAFVLFRERRTAEAQRGDSALSKRRFDFLKNLGEALIRPMMLRRASFPNGLHESTVNALRSFAIRVEQRVSRAALPAAHDGGKHLCFICPRALKRKVHQRCNNCNRTVCNEHSSKTLICDECQD